MRLPSRADGSPTGAQNGRGGMDSSPGKPNERAQVPGGQGKGDARRRRRQRFRRAPRPAVEARVLKMVGRRSLPSLIEATIIPSVLFYVFLVTVGPAEAMLAALTWAYGSVLRRVVTGQRIPGVLQLAVAGLTVRTIVGLMSGTFMYFLQPVATTVALSLVFFGSLWWGQPMIARMASDFCPLDSDISRGRASSGCSAASR